MAGTRESRPGTPTPDRLNTKLNTTSAASVPPPVPPGATPLYVGGLWVVREPHWRDSVDLGTAPRHVVYSAGLHDGAELAYGQLKEVATLLIEQYGLMQTAERAERWARRRAS